MKNYKTTKKKKHPEAKPKGTSESKIKDNNISNIKIVRLLENSLLQKKKNERN